MTIDGPWSASHDFGPPSLPAPFGRAEWHIGRRGRGWSRCGDNSRPRLIADRVRRVAQRPTEPARHFLVEIELALFDQRITPMATTSLLTEQSARVVGSDHAATSGVGQTSGTGAALAFAVEGDRSHRDRP